MGHAMGMLDSSVMNDQSFLVLEHRAVLAVGGADRREFLQGLVSNDATRVTAENAIYAALLTAQGRYLHDFIIAEIADALMIDAEAARLDDLRRRLSAYRLRAKVTITPRPELAVIALFGSGALAALGLPAQAGAARAVAGGALCVDPRHIALGARAIVARDAVDTLIAGFAPVSANAYDTLRLSLGIPDGSRDMPIEKALILEYGLEDLNAVDWRKGCYVGQELTARMKHRALVRKRLVAMRIDGAAPAPGSPVTRDGNEVGELRSVAGGLALALVRVEALEPGTPLSAAGAILTPLESRRAT
jgi:folate-binding protein YgfZ